MIEIINLSNNGNAVISNLGTANVSKLPIDEKIT